MNERRRFLRFNLPSEIWVTPEKGQAQLAQLHDVSRGGMGVVAVQELPLDSPVSLELHLPGDTLPVMAEGKVTWRVGAGEHRYRCGLQWIKIDAYDRARMLEHAYGEWLRDLRTQGVLV